MIRNVLVATDGTRVSRHAEDLALDLAKTYHGRLIAICVVHIESEEERGDQLALAMEALQDYKRRARQVGVDADVRVERGTPADVITQIAREANVDAIVVGTSGRQGLTHALLGSVAEKIVRNADRTVIVAK
jgi:nucleotide-binding universal stress UspA family protein